MLSVKTLEEAAEIIEKEFDEINESESVDLSEALGRILIEDVKSTEYVPGFDRSTVDGYAIAAGESFGCSDSIPAIFDKAFDVKMGEACALKLKAGQCAYVPTGAAIPEGADSVVMIEYTEDYKDGTIGILKPASPGLNIIFKGDDVKPLEPVLKKGKKISPSDIGALAAMGYSKVSVKKQLKIGVISTGDELVDISETPALGQVRDVNSEMVAAMIKEAGLIPIKFGIIKDEESLLLKTVKEALDTCDAVVISGGSSVGVKDASVRVIEACGELLLHGLAVKPGKPTILGKAGEKAILGLPGHPVAAFFVSQFMLGRLIERLTGNSSHEKTVKARLTESVGANDGRAHFIGVELEHDKEEVLAKPIRTKSGLITSLASADGYFIIPRDCEGVEKNTVIEVSIL